MNKDKRDFDVGIVGAGPAGTAAAIVCARAGLRVLIIEREPFPRDRPGESLHPGVEPILQSLGVGSELSSLARFRHAGYWLVSGKASNFIRFGGDSADLAI
jgi:2-polyprenyl-6-methoxyphenol hydroxylase-like FAD-dependent oxidoreductase